jgi:hypothetical protein
MSGEVNVRVIALLSPFDSGHKGPFIEEKTFKSPEISTRYSFVGAFR